MVSPHYCLHLRVLLEVLMSATGNDYISKRSDFRFTAKKLCALVVISAQAAVAAAHVG